MLSQTPCTSFTTMTSRPRLHGPGVAPEHLEVVDGDHSEVPFDGLAPRRGEHDVQPAVGRSDQPRRPGAAGLLGEATSVSASQEPGIPDAPGVHRHDSSGCPALPAG